MKILGLFVFVIFVEGDVDRKCSCIFRASHPGSGRVTLRKEQKDYVAKSFEYESGEKNLLLKWKLPEEYQYGIDGGNPCLHYIVQYRFLGRRIKVCETSQQTKKVVLSTKDWTTRKAVSNSYNIENLVEFSKYEVRILAESITQTCDSFYIIDNAIFNTSKADYLTNEHIEVRSFRVDKKSIIFYLENLKCNQIYGEIGVIFVIFCEDSEELVKYFQKPLENLTITLDVTLKPDFRYNYTAWIQRGSSGDRLMDRRKFVSSTNPSEPKINVRWNKNNTMVLFWSSISSYLSNISYFKIIVTEKNIKNETEFFNISIYDVFTNHELLVQRKFNSSSLVFIQITAFDSGNVSSKTGSHLTSSYPPRPNWLNENITYRSYVDNSTISVNILKSVQKYSSRFLLILIKLNKTSNEDKDNVLKLEQKLQTKFNVFNRMRIVGILNLTAKENLNLNYQIGNPQMSEGVYYLSGIKHNNKKLKEDRCYNITILSVNEFHEKYKFKQIFFNMCTLKRVHILNNFLERRYNWQKPIPIWMTPLIISLCTALVIFLLCKISHSTKRRNNLQITVSGGFSTSHVNTAISFDGENIGPILSLAVNDYEEIQENEMKANESVKKYFKKVETESFESYVRKSLKTRELQTHHAMFVKGLVHPHEVGLSIENRMKNRYSNLIAYDHSRVKLNIKRETGCSDYINANYIDDIDNQKAYIATQGPLPQTIADFWRMIWQERVKSIVMLANIYEDGKKRVEKYWPDENEKKIYGNICIRYRAVEMFADYEYRIFSVTCDGEMRQVYQIHFTSWPGHGVPLYSHTLVPIIKRMQELTPSVDSPIVVHCSGGVGRTGIILLCAICVRMAQEKGVLDMVYALDKLREKRSNMVDNYEQYKLAHLVVLECLNNLNTDIKCDDRFKQNVNRLLHTKEDKLEFIYLKENQWRDEAMKSVANDTWPYTNYPEKNRIQSLIPGNQDRVCLSKLPNQDESSTYINAVWVHGYRSPEKFIVTQQPLPNTISEFWRLIVEKDIRIVVSLNKINLLDENSLIFWPNEDEAKINPVDFLSVIFENVVRSIYFDVYSVKILENGKENLRVKIYSLKHWESGIHIPSSCEGLLSLLDTIESISHESRHILVTCWDGFKASGIYVALSYIIQRMKMEEVCDVCLSVRRIRHSREEFIANDVQYNFLYSAALCWMERNT